MGIIVKLVCFGGFCWFVCLCGGGSLVCLVWGRGQDLVGPIGSFGWGESSLITCSAVLRSLVSWRKECLQRPPVLLCDFVVPGLGVTCAPFCCVLWENLGETLGTSFLRRTLAHGETGVQCAFPGTGVSAPRRIRLTWSVYLCGKYIVFSLCFREYAQLPFFK